MEGRPRKYLVNPGRIQAATASGRGDQQSQSWQLKTIKYQPWWSCCRRCSQVPQGKCRDSCVQETSSFSWCYFFATTMQCNGLLTSVTPKMFKTFPQPLLFAPGGNLLGHHHHMACNCRGPPLHRGRGGSSKSKVNFSSEPSK